MAANMSANMAANVRHPVVGMAHSFQPWTNGFYNVSMTSHAAAMGAAALRFANGLAAAAAGPYGGHGGPGGYGALMQSPGALAAAHHVMQLSGALHQQQQQSQQLQHHHGSLGAVSYGAAVAAAATASAAAASAAAAAAAVLRPLPHNSAAPAPVELLGSSRYGGNGSLLRSTNAFSSPVSSPGKNSFIFLYRFFEFYLILGHCTH